MTLSPEGGPRVSLFCGGCGSHMGWQRWQTELMRAALSEAKKGSGRTYPNPAVGAVVARGRRIVGRGFHRRWGLPHAEVEAIRSAGRLSKGADLYVTLEPCSHYGRTPPCTEAIIESRIGRVIVSTIDPNPMVRGRGVRHLRQAGIAVEVGLEAEAARQLNEAYYKFMKQGVPFVTLKLAQTLDGKIAMQDGRSRWVTSAAARRLGRRMRAEAQAIMVGAGTVAKDDPTLLATPRRNRNYCRCVLDSSLRIPHESALIRTAGKVKTIVYCCCGSANARKRLERSGAVVKRVASSREGGVDLREVLADLAAMGVMHVFVEGGSRVASSFVRSGLVDKLVAFVAPKLVGDKDGLGAFANLGVKDLAKCYRFRLDELDRVGGDALLIFYPVRS